MTVPVIFETSAGRYEAPRDAVEWLWEALDATALPATHAALDKGLNGENVSVPPEEAARFCDALAAAGERLEPGERATAIAELRAHLSA